MTLPAAKHDQQQGSRPAQVIPSFKPIALPALAAAIRSVKHRPGKTDKPVLPAILRKESGTGH
jgi:hypothetical protein